MSVGASVIFQLKRLLEGATGLSGELKVKITQFFKEILYLDIFCLDLHFTLLQNVCVAGSNT